MSHSTEENGNGSNDTSSDDYQTQQLRYMVGPEIEIENNKTNKLTDFLDYEPLGEGSFGKVFKVTHKKSKIHFALKIVYKEGNKQNHYDREIKNLVQCDNIKNIVNLEDTWKERLSKDVISLERSFEEFDEDSVVYCIQMELCSGGDLVRWIAIPSQNKSIRDAKNICLQIVIGLKGLHSQNIKHRDLKPANILLLEKYQKDQNDLVVKIGDFGLSKETYDASAKLKQEKDTPYCGTKLYRSPQQALNQPYDKKTDIFSLGIIFYEILTSSVEETKILDNFGSIRRGELPQRFMSRFTDWGELIKSMLSNREEDRPSAFETLEKIKSFRR